MAVFDLKFKNCIKCDKEINYSNAQFDNLGGQRKVCRDCFLEAKRKQGAEYRKRNYEVLKVKATAAVRKSKYGITEDEYNEFLRAQNGVCSICMNTCSTGQALSVDHDHDTGKIRGLLCKQCNFLIGNAEDNTERLIAAYNYLMKGK